MGRRSQANRRITFQNLNRFTESDERVCDVLTKRRAENERGGVSEEDGEEYYRIAGSS